MWVCASLIFYFSKNKPLKSQRPWTKNRTNVFCPDSSCGPRRALFFVSQEVVRRKLRNRLSAAWLAYLHAFAWATSFIAPRAPRRRHKRSSRVGRHLQQRGLMVLTASLLGCHTASALAMHLVGPRMFSTAPRLPPPALAMRSIGAQLACVDPAVWAVAAGAAATIRLQREVVASTVWWQREARSGVPISRFDRNRMALTAVLLRFAFPISLGVLVRCKFQLWGLVAAWTARAIALVTDPSSNSWPTLIRIIVLAIASLYVFEEADGKMTSLEMRPSICFAAVALGFLGSGRLFL